MFIFRSLLINVSRVSLGRTGHEDIAYASNIITFALSDKITI